MIINEATFTFENFLDWSAHLGTGEFTQTRKARY